MRPSRSRTAVPSRSVITAPAAANRPSARKRRSSSAGATPLSIVISVSTDQLEDAPDLFGDLAHVHVRVGFLHAGVVDALRGGPELGDGRLREKAHDRLQDDAVG